VSKVLKAIHGKKRYIAGGTIGTGFLLTMLFTQGSSVATNTSDIKNIRTEIARIDEIPERTAKLEAQVKDLRGDFVDYRGEQRKHNSEQREDIKSVDQKLDRLLEKL